MKQSFSDILKGIDNDRDRKVRSKLPHWYDCGEKLEFPSSLSLEQCSSTATALYKAGVAARIAADDAEIRIADLTGGLGVDSWAFAGKAGAVFYNEMNRNLAEAAGRNFERLGLGNVSVNSFEVAASSDDWSAALERFRPGLIFLDPARRDSAGRKVFLLEDCSPDVLTLLPRLESLCSHILIKVSPMADITMLRRRLPGLREIHIVAAGGEVKELLLYSEAGNSGGSCITFIANPDSGEVFTIPQEVAGAVPATGIPGPGDLLFEPTAAVLKSGEQQKIGAVFGLAPLSHDSQLFVRTSGGEAPSSALFKCFEVIDTEPLCSSGLRAFAQRHPGADASARGVHLSSEELHRRLGRSRGGEDDCHVFGFATASGKHLVAARRKG